MNFVHSTPDFGELVRIVGSQRRIPAALVEKDYWVTHCLWALHRTGLAIWFKGGTSLSKGFGVIQRFSEDLDLMIEAGSVQTLPRVENWNSTNRGRVEQRRAFYDALTGVLEVPDAAVALDPVGVDKYARAAVYLARYPGKLLDQLPEAMSPFVRLEVGHARVIPHVEVAMSSFVHEYLEGRDQLEEFEDNRPAAVRCAHPLVTLFDKLDAMDRRYDREPFEAEAFVRHYEDAAWIVQELGNLPPIEMSATELADDMVADRAIRARPRTDAPALRLDDDRKRATLEAAHGEIAPMFWGERISLDEACAALRDWIAFL